MSNEVDKNTPEHAMRATGYALWLPPEGESFEAFKDIIQDFSDRYNTPAFSPHVTLIGGIHLPEEEVVERSHALAASQSPFPITLHEAGSEEVWFKKLFIRAGKSRQLGSLYNRAKASFQVGAPTIEPHMSILYGYPQTPKETLVAELNTTNYPKEFTVYSMDVVDTNGPVEDWHSVSNIPFISQSAT